MINDKQEKVEAERVVHQICTCPLCHPELWEKRIKGGSVAEPPITEPNVGEQSWPTHCAHGYLIEGPRCPECEAADLNAHFTPFYFVQGEFNKWLQNNLPLVYANFVDSKINPRDKIFLCPEEWKWVANKLLAAWNAARAAKEIEITKLEKSWKEQNSAANAMMARAEKAEKLRDEWCEEYRKLRDDIAAIIRGDNK